MVFRKHKKIIWLVEPFNQQKDAQRSVAHAIRTLMEGQSFSVEPIYLLSGFVVDVSLELPVDYVLQAQISAQKALDQALNRFSFPELLPLQVHSEGFLPERQGMIDLVHYAKRTSAYLIALGTRARKGLGRWVMGSFTETMMMLSDVPLLVVNPRWNRVPHFKHILFPTDFSDASKRAFLEILHLAKSMGSKVTLFHKMDYGFLPYIELPIDTDPQHKVALKKSLDRRHIEAWRWRDQAKRTGVSVNIFIDYSSRGGIAESILTYIQKNPGLIAMAAHSGALRTAILGSTTRKVVRASPDPVWIWHPQKKGTRAELESRGAAAA